MAFNSEHQPKERKPRGKGKRTLMLDAVRATCGDEEEFLQKVVSVAIGDKDTPPNTQLLTLVLQRIEPPMKSTMPMVNFALRKDSSPLEQASDVMQAASQGEIAPDVASVFIGSIANLMKINEVAELEARIEMLENQNDGE